MKILRYGVLTVGLILNSVDAETILIGGGAIRNGNFDSYEGKIIDGLLPETQAPYWIRSAETKSSGGYIYNISGYTVSVGDTFSYELYNQRNGYDVELALSRDDNGTISKLGTSTTISSAVGLHQHSYTVQSGDALVNKEVLLLLIRSADNFGRF